jgi:hypothetical protein
MSSSIANLGILVMYTILVQSSLCMWFASRSHFGSGSWNFSLLRVAKRRHACPVKVSAALLWTFLKLGFPRGTLSPQVDRCDCNVVAWRRTVLERKADEGKRGDLLIDSSVCNIEARLNAIAG